MMPFLQVVFPKEGIGTKGFIVGWQATVGGLTSYYYLENEGNKQHTTTTTTTNNYHHR